MRPGPVVGFADALVVAWAELGFHQPAGIYPRWAVYAFEAGEKAGLQVAAHTDEAFREALGAAHRLGGPKAVRDVLESLLEGGSHHPEG